MTIEILPPPVVDGDDPAQRARSAADLAWWVEAGHAALADLDTLAV